MTRPGKPIRNIQMLSPESKKVSAEDVLEMAREKWRLETVAWRCLDCGVVSVMLDAQDRPLRPLRSGEIPIDHPDHPCSGHHGAVGQALPDGEPPQTVGQAIGFLKEMGIYFDPDTHGPLEDYASPHGGQGFVRHKPAVELPAPFYIGGCLILGFFLLAWLAEAVLSAAM